MSRWLVAVFLLLGLLGFSVPGSAHDARVVAGEKALATVCADAQHAATPEAPCDAPAMPHADAESAVDASGIVETGRSLLAVVTPFAVPKPFQWSLLATPFLEGLKRPPRA